MKEIQLTRGHVAVVDDADYEWLSQYTWRSMWNKGARSPYAIRTGPRRSTILMHREILGLAGHGTVGDHKNHDTLDNRRKNLRSATYTQNAINRRTPSDNTSGLKGVCWFGPRGKWRARIRTGGKRIVLGYFNDRFDAHAAYLAAAERYHGEFATKE